MKRGDMDSGHRSRIPSAPTLPPAFPSPLPEQLLTKVELKLSCRNVLDMDVFSKSDPFVVGYMKTRGQYQDNWVEIDRTETVWNNLNPDFVKSFVVDYHFEEFQPMKFEVYDNDNEGSRNLRAHDFIGSVTTSLGSVVGEYHGETELQLQNEKHPGKRAGTLVIRAEEVCLCKDVVTLSLSGKGLDRKDWFGQSDPYLEFQRCNEDNSYTVVHRTEVIKNTLNPIWKTFTLPVQVLCNGDHHRNIKIYCYDWNSNGTSDLIGVFETNLEDLKGYKTVKPSSYDLHHVDKNGNTNTVKSGTVHIQECTIEQRPSFFDYLTGGLALNFVVAIDFTASNGPANDPTSLHYSSPTSPSQYVEVLQSIGQVLEDYDTDKLFPSFGFGARLPPSWKVSHDFALNFNPQDPHCQGVQGIIDAYYNSVLNVQLYGPTNFAPVINSCARIAQSVPPGSQYFVLLIITDGIISDMNHTKQAIIDAALLPISIIIVGVGGADFDAMEELDGDDVRVNYNGRYAARDIVQFVPFRNYDQYNGASLMRLTKDVLHELPGQVVEYMTLTSKGTVQQLNSQTSDPQQGSSFFWLFVISLFAFFFLRWIFQ